MPQFTSEKNVFEPRVRVIKQTINTESHPSPVPIKVSRPEPKVKKESFDSVVHLEGVRNRIHTTLNELNFETYFEVDNTEGSESEDFRTCEDLDVYVTEMIESR